MGTAANCRHALPCRTEMPTKWEGVQWTDSGGPVWIGHYKFWVVNQDGAAGRRTEFTAEMRIKDHVETRQLAQVGTAELMLFELDYTDHYMVERRAAAASERSLREMKEEAWRQDIESVAHQAAVKRPQFCTPTAEDFAKLQAVDHIMVRPRAGAPLPLEPLKRAEPLAFAGTGMDRRKGRFCTVRGQRLFFSLPQN